MEAQAPLVSLVLVTMRPPFLPATRAMIDRQTYRQVEVVIGLHGHKVGDLSKEQRRALAPLLLAQVALVLRRRLIPAERGECRRDLGDIAGRERPDRQASPRPSGT